MSTLCESCVFPRDEASRLEVSNIEFSPRETEVEGLVLRASISLIRCDQVRNRV